MNGQVNNYIKQEGEIFLILIYRGLLLFGFQDDPNHPLFNTLEHNSLKRLLNSVKASDTFLGKRSRITSSSNLSRKT